MSEQDSRSGPERSRSQLHLFIDEYSVSAQKLEALLTEEFEALGARNVNSLQRLAGEKLTCVETMDRLENERQSIAVSAGFGTASDAMPDLLEWCDEESSLSRRWSALLEIAARCEQQNRCNGAISRVRQEQVRGALATLGGASNATPVYGPAGKESGGSSRRELAQA